MGTEVWVLDDNRAGNRNQAIALAQELGLSYQVKKIKYNLYSKLPNFLLAISPIHVNKKNLELLEGDPLPKIIISAGRRSAPVALYLKRRSNNHLKIIQIMRPDARAGKFDLIILPQHDNFSPVTSNVIRIIGALNNVKPALPFAKEELRKHYPELKNFIAVMIGGSSKNYKFDNKEAELLSSIVSTISINHSLPLFFSFSRRTPASVKKIITNNFRWPHIVYDPAESNTYNPYLHLLGAAEYIISTADSISMCSEAVSTGTPFYIFYPEVFKLKKHRFFIQQLVDLGVARRLDKTTSFLKDYKYQPLCEIKKVANIIRLGLLKDQ